MFYFLIKTMSETKLHKKKIDNQISGDQFSNRLRSLNVKEHLGVQALGEISPSVN